MWFWILTLSEYQWWSAKHSVMPFIVLNLSDCCFLGTFRHLNEVIVTAMVNKLPMLPHVRPSGSPGGWQNHTVMCGNCVLPAGGILHTAWWATTFVTLMVIFILSNGYSIEGITSGLYHHRTLELWFPLRGESILGCVPTAGLFAMNKPCENMKYWKWSQRCIRLIEIPKKDVAKTTLVSLLSEITYVRMWHIKTHTTNIYVYIYIHNQKPFHPFAIFWPKASKTVSGHF